MHQGITLDSRCLITPRLGVVQDTGWCACNGRIDLDDQFERLADPSPKAWNGPLDRIEA